TVSLETGAYDWADCRAAGKYPATRRSHVILKLKSAYNSNPNSVNPGRVFVPTKLSVPGPPNACKVEIVAASSNVSLSLPGPRARRARQVRLAVGPFVTVSSPKPPSSSGGPPPLPRRVSLSLPAPAPPATAPVTVPPIVAVSSPPPSAAIRLSPIVPV